MISLYQSETNNIKKQILPFLVHLSALINSSSDTQGSVVMANVVINANGFIRKECIINTADTLNHDCIIGNYVHISSGVHLVDQVSIGNNSWIRTGANIINNLNIYSDVIVGVGTTILDDIKGPGKYVGLPLRKID